MYITNITDDDNDTLSIKNNCTNSDNNIEIVIPFITKIPCGMSLKCSISLMVCTLIKPLFNKKIHTNIFVIILQIYERFYVNVYF